MSHLRKNEENHMNYVSTEWKAVLEKNNLPCFDAIWQLSLPIVDSGNYGRGGFSVVSRYELTLPSGEKQTVYIKRQEDYLCFNWRKPWKRMPTFLREFNNWKLFQRLGIPTFDVVYFAAREQGKHQQAILITREIPGVDLQTWLSEMQPSGAYTFAQKAAVTKAVAETLRQLHEKYIKHGHMAGNHVFVNVKPNEAWPGNIKSSLIDLELLRHYFWCCEYRIADLAKLCRRSPRCSLTQYMRFYKHYWGISRLTPKTKKMWRTVAKRIEKKLASKKAVEVTGG